VATQHKSSGCTVPRVTGKTPTVAKDRIFDHGCSFRSAVAHAYSNKVRKGRVIRTIPAAGRTTNAKVRLVVSKGRRHRRAHASTAPGVTRAQLAQLQQLANAPLH
jgi:beta-lactam-binding protein with PASTA domain